jgi:ribosomal protein S18 acetylase RimI-like enzyme
MAPGIRPFTPADRAAVYDVCVRTADAGGDARGLYLSDDLMPDVFAGPYLELAPELAFVLDDGGAAVGYVVGCADTVAFAAAFRDRWLPEVAGRYPRPDEVAAAHADSAWLVRDLHHPERMVIPELAAHPAHLHIDLLPPYQGGGHGRALIETFLAAAAREGAAAVHLGVNPQNTRALGFYEHLGFRRIEITSREVLAVFLGRPTG